MKTSLKIAQKERTFDLEPPSSLEPNLRPLFSELAQHLLDLGLFLEADKLMLVNYCRTQVLLDEALSVAAKEGSVIVSPHGVKTHPAITAAATLTTNLTKMGSLLGIGAAARKRISVEAAQASKASSTTSNPWKAEK